MTAAAFTPITLTAEPHPSAAVSSFSKEHHDLILSPNHPSNTSHLENFETLFPAAPRLPPLFIDSIAELKNLSAAIASFQHCYDDLRNHLDSIKATITSKLLPEAPRVAPVAPFSPNPGVSDRTGFEIQEQGYNPLVSYLDYLCQTMCGPGLRKYLVTHLSNIAWMREEVPRALRMAPNPPKLVLETMGRFYLQSGKAISKNLNSLPFRDASVFILECFLLMMGMDSANGKENGGLSIENDVKVEAEEAVLAWWKRIENDGGLALAEQIDVRGLLFLIACFGIPRSLNGYDIRALLAAADTREIAGVLRNSHLLMNKIPEIVLEMLKHNKDVDAVNLVYTFGFEETFDPHAILVSYLRRFNESPRWDQGSAALNEMNKRQLAGLKSLRRCLEQHNVDPAKLLPGWRIQKMIKSLENDFDDAIARRSEDRSFLHRRVSESESPRNPTSRKPKFDRFLSRGPQQLKTTGRGRGRGNFSSRGRVNRNYPRGAMANRGWRVQNNGINPYVWHRDAGEFSPVGVGSTGSYTSVEDGSPVAVESRLFHSPNLW